ncbi:MAG: ClpXP protease specificity-enhancing factor [Betaproteobacteria bacterium]|jgi:stringent starvation protein B|nr:ClpXP protease specificity-enhancing factor [Betaproteobacteria bacterium]
MADPSTKPYLVRAIHEWCTDNGFTPYLAVTVDERTIVPPGYARNGEIVLNASVAATNQLRLDNDFISFQARFNGRAHDILVPVTNVSAIYARENGHGMAFEVPKSPAVVGPGEARAQPVSNPGAERTARPLRGKPTLALAPAPGTAPVAQEGELTKLPAAVAVLATVPSKPRAVPPIDGSAHAETTNAPSDGASAEGGLAPNNRSVPAGGDSSAPTTTSKPRTATRASRLRASFPSVETGDADAPASSVVPADSETPVQKGGASRRRSAPVAEVALDSKVLDADPPNLPDGGPDEGPTDGPKDGPKSGPAGRAKLTRIK